MLSGPLATEFVVSLRLAPRREELEAASLMVAGLEHPLGFARAR